MPNIVWEGNKKEFGTLHSCAEPPKPYGIAPMVICMLAVFLKAFINKQPPLEPLFLILAFIIGFLIALPFHEFMHALCYPKGATVWVGLCLRKIAASDNLRYSRISGVDLSCT